MKKYTYKSSGIPVYEVEDSDLILCDGEYSLSPSHNIFNIVGKIKIYNKSNCISHIQYFPAKLFDKIYTLEIQHPKRRNSRKIKDGLFYTYQDWKNGICPLSSFIRKGIFDPTTYVRMGNYRYFQNLSSSDFQKITQDQRRFFEKHRKWLFDIYKKEVSLRLSNSANEEILITQLLIPLGKIFSSSQNPYYGIFSYDLVDNSFDKNSPFCFPMGLINDYWEIYNKCLIHNHPIDYSKVNKSYEEEIEHYRIPIYRNYTISNKHITAHALFDLFDWLNSGLPRDEQKSLKDTFEPQHQNFYDSFVGILKDDTFNAIDDNNNFIRDKGRKTKTIIVYWYKILVEERVCDSVSTVQAIAMLQMEFPRFSVSTSHYYDVPRNTALFEKLQKRIRVLVASNQTVT